jgi:hypothetical protein
MHIPAGATPPAPDDLRQLAVVHAVDGDGSAVCGLAPVEPVDHNAWTEAAPEQRCKVCRAVIGF